MRTCNTLKTILFGVGFFSFLFLEFGILVHADSPAIESISPATIQFGGVVTIKGSGFGGMGGNAGGVIYFESDSKYEKCTSNNGPRKLQVYFGWKLEHFVSWTDTEIKLQLPSQGTDDYLVRAKDGQFIDKRNDICPDGHVDSFAATASNEERMFNSGYVFVRKNVLEPGTQSIIGIQDIRGGENTRWFLPGGCSSDQWACGDWNNCSVDGSQTRTCNKTFTCPLVQTPPPETSKSCVYIPPTCTSWKYSEWSDCSMAGQQTRTVTSADPVKCIGGNPTLSQSCTPPPPLCDTDTWSCGNWNNCSVEGSQTRTCNKTFDCQSVDTPSPSVSQSCTPPPQPKPVTPVTPPPVYQPPPPQQPTCDVDIWTCGDWNSCSLSGVQNRSCRKTLDCPNVETAPPTTDQYCEAPNRPTQQVPQDSSEISNQDTIIKATVKLMCLVDENSGMQGSGTVIDPSGIILTNKHVVAGTLGCFVGFINNSDDVPYFGDRQIADIQKTSPNEDVAILKLRNPQNRKLTYIDITKANSNFRLGTKVNLYGYPAIFGTNMTYTDGTFSGVDGSYLKTTAIIEHGNSGGGAYLNNGMFVGIPSGVIKGELNALGYILSVNVINAWLENSSIVYNGNSNQNNYSRVSSVLENIDLKKLNSIELIVPGTKKSKEITNKTPQSSPTAPPSIIKKTAPSKIENKTTNSVVASSTQDQNFKRIQTSEHAETKQQVKTSLVKRFFQWIANRF